VSIKYAMLGFLSEAPQTGYDLKKRFSDSDLLHWSGNSNQVYRSLVELHDEGLVTLQVEQQDSKPPRKIYTITPAGLQTLQAWLVSVPEASLFRSPLSTQLLWSDLVERADLCAMLSGYADNVRDQMTILGEQARRATALGATQVQQSAFQHALALVQCELDWVLGLCHDVEASQKG